MQHRLFLILIFSHLVGDFVIQNQRVLKKRYPDQFFCGPKKARKEILRGNLEHCLYHFLIFLGISGCIFLWSMQLAEVTQTFQVFTYVGAMIVYLVSHFAIDCMKSWWVYRYPKLQSNLFFFLGDQACHFIVFCLLMIQKIPSWSRKVFHAQGAAFTSLSCIDRFLLTGILFVIATFFAGIFIKVFMEHLDYNNEKSQEQNIPQKAKQNKRKIQEKVKQEAAVTTECEDGVDGEIRQGGYIIGILERFFIIIAMVISTPQLIGFMLTVKCIVRLKKMSKDKFAEYFLIGNLLSFLFAIAVGVMIQALWS